MARHARNACSYSVFSAAERRRLTYGTQSRRVGGDAQKPFDHCELCLHTAEQPVICHKGHVYCRGCILESLSQQKELNKLAAAKYAQQQSQLSVEAAAKEQKTKEAQRANFEKLDAALLLHGNTRTDANYKAGGGGGGAVGSSASSSSAAAAASSSSAAVAAASSSAPAPAGYIRVETNSGAGFIVDRALVHAHTDVQTAAATREAQAQRKQYFPAFWMPSEAPADVGEAKMTAPPPTHCLCPAGSHPLKLKQLRPLRWHMDQTQSAPETKATSTGGATSVVNARFCPLCFACKRALDNRIPMMANLHCGHVVCKACVDSLMVGKKATAAAESAAAAAAAASSSAPSPAPRLQCVECEDPCSLSDLVAVVAATGYAATGNTVAKAKLTPSFLC